MRIGVLTHPSPLTTGQYFERAILSTGDEEIAAKEKTQVRPIEDIRRVVQLFEIMQDGGATRIPSGAMFPEAIEVTVPAPFGTQSMCNSDQRLTQATSG